MNMKIMELAAQAEEYMEIPMPDDVYHMGDDIFRRHKIFNREKFAELIVRECAGIVEDYGLSLVGSDENYLGETLNLSIRVQEAGNKIKKHFGVEE